MKAHESSMPTEWKEELQKLNQQSGIVELPEHGIRANDLI